VRSSSTHAGGTGADTGKPPAAEPPKTKFRNSSSNANEYHAAQARGEVAKAGDNQRNREVIHSANDLGLSRKQVHDVGQVRDAEKRDGRGHRSPAKMLARDERDKLMIEIARRFYSGLSHPCCGEAGSCTAGTLAAHMHRVEVPARSRALGCGVLVPVADQGQLA
jgi:hypothetical protein